MSFQNDFSNKYNSTKNNQNISGFFANKTIFLTGGTGFLGKVIIEKLLRTCPDIKCIYLLIRCKRNFSINERLDNIINSHLFKNVCQIIPNIRKKVIGVNGDIMEHELGLSQEDKNLLQSQVHIVIHSAATVRFDEKLRLAIQINVEGTKKLLELSANMKNLMAIVHVSTAYANCIYPQIEEKIYLSSNSNPFDLITSLSWMNDEMVEKISSQLLEPYPNSYTFSKQITEQLVRHYAVHQGLPVCIVRPSIVTAALREPFPGWVDNFNGPTGLIAATGRGLLRCMKGNGAAVCDLVPVDLVANLVLASAWNLGLQRGEGGSGDCSDGPTVYHCTSHWQNQLTWKELTAQVGSYFDRFPSSGCLRIPSIRLTESRLWFWLQLSLNHSLPAWLADCWLALCGRRPIFVGLDRRLQRGVHSMTYFTSRGWRFHHSNTTRLMEQLLPEDRHNFSFDTSQINWSQYIVSYIDGIRKFALKEDMTEFESKRAHIKKLQWINFIVHCSLAVATWRFLICRIPCWQFLWTRMLSLALQVYRMLPQFVRA